ncbi:lipid-A-disaccharide synthase [Legionella quinlivanii]|uniref:Lipid-A-disaccharide synthase n=1 Tax=Legionella quinlivanii TaxID=45073 RepID=A0A0W0Y4A8_9GAMM|nr:lipid-A-disaccharide synthase [Legionella quinlivanii]KTD51519.1 lipid-A-disaccharide synthase [Legionella quinlivanii]SEF57672.1 lipid-A-disaccharide synthase [Legionella quinlivanii DSM 21216]STY10955.1 lipid-A-disaccharide synthase [Legionella quinlivanii]
MLTSKKLVIIAGEESGDMHAAELVRRLLNKDPGLQFSGIGGRHMQEAGVFLVNDLARYAVTGLTEVLKHIRVIKQAFKEIKAHLEKNPPDLLILVDYPGFNLRLARFAKQQLNLKIIYYISPQIWAWKPQRIHTIKACVDKMAVILPFEKTLYQQAGVPVSFVGHPLVKKIPHFENSEALRQTLNLPANCKLVALLPGSRLNEITHHVPVFVQTIQQLNTIRSDLHFVIPIAKTLNSERVKQYVPAGITNISFLNGQSLETAACSDCVVVASGTASLETALLKKPMCIVYKGNLLSYLVAMKVIRVKYFGLCNLLTNKMVAPELLQYDFNVHELSKMIENLLDDQAFTQRMLRQLHEMKVSLSTEAADESIDELVLHELIS